MCSRRCLSLATDQEVSCVTLQMLRVSWAALSLSSPRHSTSDNDLHKFCSSTVKMLLLYFPEKSLEPQENRSLIVQLPAEGAVGNGRLKRLHISSAPLFTKILMLKTFQIRWNISQKTSELSLIVLMNFLNSPMKQLTHIFCPLNAIFR